MRSREHLSGTSGSPRSCSHANTRAPFSSFRQPEVLFACEHASTFLELPAPRGLVRMRTRGRLSRASSSPRSYSHANTRAPFWSFRLPRFVRMRTRNRLSRASSSPRSCSHANTRAPFSSFRQPEVLFACEHASTFLELPAPRGLVRMRTRGRLSRASSSPRSYSHANTRAPFWSFRLPRFVRMRTRNRLSRASSSPRSCSHANTRTPFLSFRLPEVLFACEHASTFLGLPAPRGLVRMRTRNHLSAGQNLVICTPKPNK